MSIKPPPSYLNPDRHAVAVLGMSIATPGGKARGLDTKAFYEFLERRGSGIITVPADRWTADAFHGNAPGKMIATKGGFIPELAYGDPREFGISPAQASQMKADQIILLHQAFAALQRSGVDSRGTSTGVFIGCSKGQLPYEMDITQVDEYYTVGNMSALVANRISYVFDLLGPSVPVDTACSSSLTAMHLAVQAIRAGDCHQAVVAGINFITSPIDSVSYSKSSFLSPDGVSKPFDEAADGYGRADTAGAVVIKRHDLAVQDYNNILASLVGTSITTCGSIMGSLTTPSPHAQSQAIRNAYCDAGLYPHHVDFVELHGTGTVVGDQTETNAAGAVFAEGREGRAIVIGSVKSNVGHGETGAYMNSLIKVIMMLQKRKILPNGYFKNSARRIDFSRYNLRVPVEVEDMIAGDPARGLIASISSIGIGGACGHTVLREHERRPVLSTLETLKSGPFLFAVGALTPKSCTILVHNYKQPLNIDHLALSEHMGMRARQMPWRTYAVSPSISSARFLEPILVGKRPNPVILCFSGQGPQHWQQGRVLMDTYSVFRESVYACDVVHKQYTGTSFLGDTGLFVSPAPKDKQLKMTLDWPASIISISLAFFQIALFDLLTSLGVRADAIVGHSLGETAVLYASGAVPRDMAIKVAIARGRALSLVDNVGGAMVAVSGCDNIAVSDYIEAVSVLAGSRHMDTRLFIAAYNSPTDIGVSGSEASIVLLMSYINTWVEGTSARKLHVSTAVHSPYVDPCETSYRAELKAIFAQYSGSLHPTTLTMSTVTGEFMADGYTVDYLWRNLRQPVRFSTAISKLIEHFGKDATFVEVAPHPVLSQYIKKMGAHDALAASRRPPSARQLKGGVNANTESHVLLEVLGKLLTCGVNSINFSALTSCPETVGEEIPYPFQGKVLPIAPREPTYLRRLLQPARPFNSPRLRLSPSLPESWLAEYVVDGSIVVSAAVYIEMALEFPGVTQVLDCHFEAACILDDSTPPITLEVAKQGIKWSVKSSTALQTMTGDLEWTRSSPVFDKLHARGKLGFGVPEMGLDAITKVDTDAVLRRCISTHSKDEIYNFFKPFFRFGPQFQRMKKIALNETENICWMHGHIDSLGMTDYAFHPLLIDAVLQSSFGWTILYDRINVDGTDRSIIFFPHSLRRAYRTDGSSGPLILPAEFRTYTRLVEWTPEHQLIDAYVLNDDDTVLFTFEGLRLANLTQSKDTVTERFTTIWQPRALPATSIMNETRVSSEQSSGDETLLLQVLDYLAMRYTTETLKTIPDDFASDVFDRRAYLTWARKQVFNFEHSEAPLWTSSLEREYEVLFEVTHRIGNVQKEIFTASTAAVQVLFRDNIMSKLYECFPFDGEVIDSVVARFVDLVKEAIAVGKRVVRVLEVGAGTGRLTALLGKALIDAKLDLCYVDYVSTDISISLAQEAALKSPWPTMTPMAFDLGIDIVVQGLDPSSFDIIVAFDVLHAVPMIKNTMDTLQRLLLPGGHVAIIELDGRRWAQGGDGTIWGDFVFGSFNEWMGVLEHRPGAAHCTLSPDQWKNALVASNFSAPMMLTSGVGFHFAFISQGMLAPVQVGPSMPASILVSTPSTTDVKDDFDAPVVKLLNHPGISDLASQDGSKVNDDLVDMKDKLTIIYGYRSGGEIELVKFVAGLSSSKAHILWLHTDTDYNNAKLVGIVRSMRKEYNLWKIMLVLFDSWWSTSKRKVYIMEHLIPLEYVDADILVDQGGSIHVSRLVASPEPPKKHRRGTYPIQFDKTNIWRAFPLPLGPGQVEVTVEFVNVTPAFSGHFEFSGVVTDVGTEVKDKSIAGQRVCGILAEQPGSVAICSQLNIAPLPGGLSPAVAAAVVGRLAFLWGVVKKGLQSASTASPLILLHAAELSPAARATYRYLRELGNEVIVTVEDSSVISNDRSKVYLSTRYDIWVSHAQRWARGGVDVIFNFSSDDIVWEESIPILAKNGTMVQIGGQKRPREIQPGQQYLSIDYDVLLANQQAVAPALSISPEILQSMTPMISTYDIGQLEMAHEEPFPSLDADRATLLDIRVVDENVDVYRGGVIDGTLIFNPRATYALLGGVCGFGVALTQCMVDRGARHIVLTSRSGEGGLTPGRFVLEKRLIKALRSRPGVTIDIVSLDCLDVVGTKSLFAKMTPRIAGVFYLPLSLNDQLFANMTTAEHWKPIADVKTKGLQVLLQAVDPKSLEFLVLASTFSTVIGSEGQANYASASSEMEAFGAQLPNTVSVTIPAITNTGAFVRALPLGDARALALNNFHELFITAMDVSEHCIDAIRALNTVAHTSLYIPSTSWRIVAERSPPYVVSAMRHLLVKAIGQTKTTQGLNTQSIRGVCASALSLSPDAIEDTVPFSTYGLDSLTSVRLSGILKKDFNLEVTQMQLLSSHMTVEKLQSMHAENGSATQPVAEHASSDHAEGQGKIDATTAGKSFTIVRLNKVIKGTPLFIIHGAGGGIGVFRKLGPKVNFPTYGVQDTPDTPISGSLSNLARFYLEKIREIQLHGPYRLCGYSFGCCITLYISNLLREEGETVDMLIMVDGSPAHFSLPVVQQHIRKGIIDGGLQDDIMEMVIDIRNSQIIDNADSMVDSFRDHFQKITGGESGVKWLSRFYQAYAAHLLMGLRGCQELSKHSQMVGRWPAERTILLRGTEGWLAGLEARNGRVDLNFIPGIDEREIPGTHAGILNPVNGLPFILNEALKL